MQRSRLAPWLVFGGVLCLLVAIGGISSVLGDWEQTGGQQRLNALTVNLDRTAAVSAADATGLTLEEAEALAEQWEPQATAYSSRAQTSARYQNSSASCTVIGVNEQYRNFNSLPMLSGSMIGQTSVTENSRVAVISSWLAEQLYRSNRVVGKQLELFGTTFTITGVYAGEETLLKRMAEDGIPDVLIPVTTFLSIQPDASIETVQLAVGPAVAVGREDQVSAALGAVGKNPALFRIANRGINLTQAAQLKSLLLFGCGIIALVQLIRLVLRHVKAAARQLKRRLLTNHWPEALRMERAYLLKTLSVIITVLIFMVALWSSIAFRLSLLPDWVPERLIDVSFYFEHLQAIWQQQTLQAGYVPSAPEQLDAAAARLVGWLFLGGGLLGLPLLLLGIRLWQAERMPAYAQLQRLSYYLPPAVLITFALISWAGWDFRLNQKEIIVPGMFFLVSIFNFNESKGVDIS
ncbi:ABC transporter permease [Paenibacillus macerans]|uniref:ABC transporter permease n=1 Tax=Paenibacillus macerans TaxID=44252 RepID=UPI003D32266D